MQALVSSPNYIYLLDVNTKKYRVLKEASNKDIFKGEFYGISWTSSSDLCLTRSNFNNSFLKTTEDYLLSERGFLTIGKNKSVSCLSAPHQILCTKDNKTLVTNTGRNCVTVFDNDTLFYKNIWLDDSTHWDRLGDNKYGFHINSLFIKNKFIYITCHNWNKASKILKCTYPDFKIKEEYSSNSLKWIHNVWLLENNNIVTCNTYYNSLINISTNKTLWQSKDKTILTRGLASTNNITLLGGSVCHKKNEDRRNSTGKIFILNRKGFTLEDEIVFPKSGGINSIRILDEFDNCHQVNVFKMDKLLEQINYHS